MELTSSTNDNTKLLQQLKSEFKRTTYWKKKYVGTYRFFSLFENNIVRTEHIWYFLPTLKRKDYNVTNDERNFFDRPIKIDIRTYENIQKKFICQGNDYTTASPLDYSYFKENYM